MRRKNMPKALHGLFQLVLHVREPRRLETILKLAPKQPGACRNLVIYKLFAAQGLVNGQDQGTPLKVLTDSI